METLEDNIADAIDAAVAAPEKLNNTIIEDKPVAAKKKPGRPKKNTAIAQIDVQGIKNAPHNEDHVFELVYSNPMMFGKILDLYKQYEVSNVDMMFDASGVKMKTKDHIGKSNIYIQIDGHCMNWYYCKAPMRVCIERSSLEKVFDMLTKDHTKVTIISEAETFRSKMYVIIKDSFYDIDVQYEIDVVYKAADVDFAGDADDDSQYPIKFNMTTKHFKAQITRIKKLDKVAVLLQKNGDNPLQFTHEKVQTVKGTCIYNGPGKINLVSTLAPDDIFSISINFEYITPFTGSGVGEQVYICADKQKKISLATMLDRRDLLWACHIKIYTEIRSANVQAM